MSTKRQWNKSAKHTENQLQRIFTIWEEKIMHVMKLVSKSTKAEEPTFISLKKSLDFWSIRLSMKNKPSRNLMENTSII